MTQAAQTLNANANLTRRQFLAMGWTVAGFIAVGESTGAVVSFLYPRFAAGAFGTKISVGPLQDILKALPDPSARPGESQKQTGRFYLTRTADGILALYRKCVHLGCVVPWNDAEDIFHCVCHGSKYDRKGEVLAGPAPRPLDYFQISEEEGVLVVDTSNAIKRTGYEPSQVFPLH